MPSQYMNVPGPSHAEFDALNRNVTKHYIQIAAQPGSTLADSVKATLNQYPYFSSLSTGDLVAIAGGWAGVTTYTINFTKEDTYKFAGTVYVNENTYSFVYNNQQNSLTMVQLAKISDLNSHFLQPGTTEINSPSYSFQIYSGYITGSGNYIDVFIPCDVKNISGITSVTLGSDSIAFTTGGMKTMNGAVSRASYKCGNGIYAEFTLPSLGTEYTPASLRASSIKIVAT